MPIPIGLPKPTIKDILMGYIFNLSFFKKENCHLKNNIIDKYILETLSNPKLPF